jgi:hypothetical protein
MSGMSSSSPAPSAGGRKGGGGAGASGGSAWEPRAGGGGGGGARGRAAPAPVAPRACRRRLRARRRLCRRPRSRPRRRRRRPRRRRGRLVVAVDRRYVLAAAAAGAAARAAGRGVGGGVAVRGGPAVVVAGERVLALGVVNLELRGAPQAGHCLWMDGWDGSGSKVGRGRAAHAPEPSWPSAWDMGLHAAHQTSYHTHIRTPHKHKHKHKHTPTRAPGLCAAAPRNGARSARRRRRRRRRFCPHQLLRKSIPDGPTVARDQELLALWEVGPRLRRVAALPAAGRGARAGRPWPLPRAAARATAPAMLVECPPHSPVQSAPRAPAPA